MEEDIQVWLDSAREESQFMLEYWKTRELGDPDEWGSLLASSFQDGGAVTGRGVLLAGGDNHSKQAVALQILGLLKPEAFEGIFLNGADLSDGGFAQARKKLDGLLDHFYDKGMGLCLVLDGLEECACRPEILRFMGQKLCEYTMYSEELTPLFLILMDDREQDIPGLLRDCLQLCRLQLPNKTKRAAYLETHAKSLRNYLSLEIFAKATEGISYVQLQDMISLAEHYVDSRDGRALSDEELKTFVAGQMPDLVSEQPLKTLCKSVQQLVEQLPKIIRNAPVANVVQQPQIQAQAAPQAQLSSVPGREEIEKMPPRQLAVDLFGEDFVSDMQQSVMIMQ